LQQVRVIAPAGFEHELARRGTLFFPPLILRRS
jgi:hypothetical protein